MDRKRRMMSAQSTSVTQQLMDGAPFVAQLTKTLALQRGTGSATFTRATTGSVQDHEGVLRTAIAGEARFTGARGVSNLLPSTEGAFDAGAGWTVLNGTVTPNVSDPNGGTSAYTLRQTGASSCELYPTTPFSGSVLSSVWLRRRTGTGTISLYGGDTVTNITASVTSEWQRIPSHPTNSSAVGFDLRLFDANDEVDFWHPQAEDTTGRADQTTPSEYVSVGVASAPYYHGAGVDGVKYFDTDLSGNPLTTLKGYLAEGARTNLCTKSQEFDAWTGGSGGAGTNPVVTANAGTAPDGTATADKVVFSAPGAGDLSVIASPVFTTVVASVYTSAVYVKAFAAGDVGKQILTRQAGASGYTALTLTADWQRLGTTETAAGTSTTFDILLRPTFGGSSGTVSVYLWGAQLELGSFASSYIPTTTIAVARNADVLTYTGGDTPNLKALMCGFRRESGVSDAGWALSMSDGTTSNYESISVDSATEARFLGVSGWATQWDATPSYAAGTTSKAAFSAATNDVKMAKDGSPQTQDTSATVPTVTQLNVGHVAGSFQLNGHVSSVVGWTRNLSQSELNAITQP